MFFPTAPLFLWLTSPYGHKKKLLIEAHLSANVYDEGTL